MEVLHQDSYYTIKPLKLWSNPPSRSVSLQSWGHFCAYGQAVHIQDSNTKKKLICCPLVLVTHHSFALTATASAVVFIVEHLSCERKCYMLSKKISRNIRSLRRQTAKCQHNLAMNGLQALQLPRIELAGIISTSRCDNPERCRTD